MEFNIVDIVIGIFLIFGAYQGFSKGLIYQLTSLLGLVIGIYGAINFSNYAADYLSNADLIDAKYIKVAALFITFIAILIAIHFIGKAVESLFSLTGLGSLNTIGGVAFSLAKQLLILSFIMLGALFLNSKADLFTMTLFDDSILYQKCVLPVMNLVKGFTQNYFN